jgi:hypothetical protein
LAIVVHIAVRKYQSNAKSGPNKALLKSLYTEERKKERKRNKNGTRLDLLRDITKHVAPSCFSNTKG